MTNSNQNQKNKRVAKNVVFCVIGMFALAYASFPLYNLFCKVTGYGGTPKTENVQEYQGEIGKREITVRFNADIMKEVPWQFKPMQKQVKTHPGENNLIFYESTNESDTAVKGVATFNVTPEKAGYYFNKVQCFCFNEQTLDAGERVEMPVSFYIDPEIEKDPDMWDVNTITLSYTFFKAED